MCHDVFCCFKENNEELRVFCSELIVQEIFLLILNFITLLECSIHTKDQIIICMNEIIFPIGTGKKVKDKFGGNCLIL